MTPDTDLLAAVEARRADAQEVMRFVHDHPELGHEEHECLDFVATNGFATAFFGDSRSSVGAGET